MTDPRRAGYAAIAANMKDGLGQPWCAPLRDCEAAQERAFWDRRPEPTNTGE